MSRRHLSHYQLSLGWTLGVAYGGTLTRLNQPAQEFTRVRCCGSPRASSPHGLAAPASRVSRRTMLRAVASGSRLLPTRSVKDFHLQSSAHAGHTSTPRVPLRHYLPGGRLEDVQELAADAHYCIMVWGLCIPPHTRTWHQQTCAPPRELPSMSSSPTPSEVCRRARSPQGRAFGGANAPSLTTPARAGRPRARGSGRGNGAFGSNKETDDENG